MSDILLGIVLFIVFIIGPFWLISKMDKRVAKKGALFTGQATGGMKVLAIVLGVIFAGIFIMELLSLQTIHLIFPILGVALIGYGLGAGQLLSKLQKGKSEEIYADYKNILDSKLIPLGFERQQEYVHAREKGISYKRNVLQIFLHNEPPFSYNAISAISGKKITSEERNNQLPPEIRNKIKYLNEQDKYKLVDALDFEIVLSESEEVKAQFLRTLDKWLTENQ